MTYKKECISCKFAKFDTVRFLRPNGAVLRYRCICQRPISEVCPYVSVSDKGLAPRQS